MEKKFKKRPDEIIHLVKSAIGKGGCLATDYIVCEGHKVGYMYREESNRKEDTGWRFLSGEEDQEYIDNLDNTGVYSINTIANYDPCIISYLEAPYGTELIRDPETDTFYIPEE